MKIADGEADAADLELLERLCDMVRYTSLCGLGQSAPQPGVEHAALLPRGVSASTLNIRVCAAGVCKTQKPAGVGA